MIEETRPRRRERESEEESVVKTVYFRSYFRTASRKQGFMVFGRDGLKGRGLKSSSTKTGGEM